MKRKRSEKKGEGIKVKKERGERNYRMRLREYIQASAVFQRIAFRRNFDNCKNQQTSAISLNRHSLFENLKPEKREKPRPFNPFRKG